MLKRINLGDRVDIVSVPTSTFNILIVTQGFTKRWDIAESCDQAWTEIRRIAFGNASLSLSQRIAVYYDDVPAPDLGLVRASSGELQIPAANAGRLTQHLKTLSLTDGDDTVWSGSDLWPVNGLGTVPGSLVLLLVKQTSLFSSGELYQIEANDRYPVPVVGVVHFGTPFWANVLARAVGQLIGRLADEFSLDGGDFAKAPEVLVVTAPNVLGVNDTVRGQLAALAGKPLDNDALGNLLRFEFLSRWQISPSVVKEIIFRSTDEANPPLNPDQAKDLHFRLIEGGRSFPEERLPPRIRPSDAADPPFRRRPCPCRTPDPGGGAQSVRKWSPSGSADIHRCWAASPSGQTTSG